MLTMEDMPMKSRAQHTLVDDTSSSPMVLLANSDPNTRRSTFFTIKTSTGHLGLGGQVHLAGQQAGSQGLKVGQQQSPSGFSVSSGQLVGQETTLPHSFITGTLQDPASIGDGHSILVTNFGNSILPTSSRPLHFHNDIQTCRVLLRCDSTGPLYLVTNPSPIPQVYLTSQYTWHQRLGHPGNEHNILINNNTWILVPRPMDANILRFHQLEVKNAFLHGDLTATFFMHQPPGFWDPTHPDYVCLSKISLWSQAGSSGLV
uniref:Ribonuclease H-like domain-containing protein n=1 Tax=Tanacetum cinerariifolium TaxID=118510 RepID=A0A699IDW1_TANCI|nr:ribonuclease H-like domain-containing protein [Tanacetum cinerariifolium]